MPSLSHLDPLTFFFYFCSTNKTTGVGWLAIDFDSLWISTVGYCKEPNWEFGVVTDNVFTICFLKDFLSIY